MKTKIEAFEVLIPTPDGNDISERVSIDVAQEWDEEIGEWLLTPESLRKIDDTKARRIGLLLPEELKALRERLSTTQSLDPHCVTTSQPMQEFHSGLHSCVSGKVH